jgi:hypothetical protein
MSLACCSRSDIALSPSQNLLQTKPRVMLC